MPDALTHCLFAKEVIETLPVTLQTLVNENMKYYLLGSSGPDACYYYGQIPLYYRPNKKSLARLGNALHEERINDYFTLVIEQFDVSTDDLKAYMLGYMTHYMLDRTCHPFVFYRSGFSNDENDAKKYMAYHKRYEVLMDRALALDKLNCDLYDRRLYDFLDVEDLSHVAAFYQTIAHQLFNIQVTKREVRDAFKDLSKAFNLAFDPHHYKYIGLSKIDKTGHSMLINTLYYPPRDDHYDVLNLSHETWLNPCTKAQSQDSMLDLIEQAKELSIEWFQVFEKDVQQKTLHLLDIVQNKQFDTGLIKEESKMLEHQCVFEYENS